MFQLLRDSAANPAPKEARAPGDGVSRRIYGIVVHGIGDQKPGATLKHVVNEFLPLVHLIDPHAGIDAKPDDDPDATARNAAEVVKLPVHECEARVEAEIRARNASAGVPV